MDALTKWFVVVASVFLGYLALALVVALPTATAILMLASALAVSIRFRHLIHSLFRRLLSARPPQELIVAESVVEPDIVEPPVFQQDAGSKDAGRSSLRMGMFRHFFSKVVGTSHLNDDGSNRQTILRQCHRHEILLLVHDKNNPHDPNAIKVCRRNGQQLGFVNRETALVVAEKIQQGSRYFAILSQVTGGVPGKEWRGANIVVVEHDAGLRPDDVAWYILEQIDH